jgi:hypothetical protein
VSHNVDLPVFVTVPDGQGFAARFNQPYSMIDVGGPGGVGLMVGAIGMQSFPVDSMDYFSESRPMAAVILKSQDKVGHSDLM